MNAISIYYLKSGIALSILYALYWFILRNGTHFKLNRFILLFSLLFSFVLPFFSFDFLFKAESTIPTFTIVFDETSTQTAIKILNTTSGWGLWQVLKIIYFAGCGFVIIRLIYQAIYIHAVVQMSEKFNYQGLTVILVSSDITPFSYFYRIFIPADKYNDQSLASVLEHERSHLQQFHLLDLLVIELLIIIQWFNPFIWFYERSLKEIHEYLADEAVLKKGVKQGSYQALLINQAIGGPVFTITNQFNQSLIKKRIIMMTKMKTPGKAKLKALLFVPLVAVLMVAFANPQKLSYPVSDLSAGVTEAISNHSNTSETETLHGREQNQAQKIIIKGKVTDMKTGEPLPGVNIVIANTTVGTQTDISGNYAIKSESSNSVLVFSFIGYKIVKESIGNRENIDVKLETDSYTIDFSKGNQMLAPDKKKENQENTKTTKDEPIYIAVEENPSYPGGTDALKEFIKKNLQYPEEAKKKKVEGTVMVCFIINPQGKVNDTKVIKGVNPLLDKEAIRLVNSINNWKPGYQNGKSVKFMVNIPIVFSLK